MGGEWRHRVTIVGKWQTGAGTGTCFFLIFFFFFFLETDLPCNFSSFFFFSFFPGPFLLLYLWICLYPFFLFLGHPFSLGFFLLNYLLFSTATLVAGVSSFYYYSLLLIYHT
ncbi:hypothetical protein BGZ63DRAFT_46969 [Mariannaea sp. PMI_226]|nr:hypothetical protein BGZ63DRAFT_46969 [Mariannaea sp. PMI_226]